ncbi:MAG: type I glyceraldehyde-3-phosphate dehydrogenase [Candidatus Yonathbacteria bacterium CG_4_10_14_3_um_filter_47_65]|uniref:Type I glyceraldehyde-3-phosphate dehydrogenase n=2 Tax=Parcubacteria group TaxID=1794811 RepID=A0A2M8D935_9BACT|nr:MAG: type I glyceraldehyde-3-phosphate dehydrogenase [Candidatus Nomurabacteria bacterium CG1_02_47_685]PIP03903.1 MAG: type I glyceraldehyde-3-phosphate dehydrogenase [Candidatus Yonathbacteria bacterium CG23_combo_of_CG06-09_8_20_14_all_46_18]PIQ31189.1 MAG: type I glyceraldehyde-3-phosphate dehydrogenase [Candidatus Yonathbacteria bacterium CG17_big_fil_post_rev_8_21_14_2_50_46_19]PIX56405.1 MAG: type I glyceraldehyde-3-phosphate dehydrogenase [Candidatus Yonathbacteria bacterium CG_4_10_1
MKKIRVAVNGLGRIGRAFFKIALKREEIEIVAVNDLGDIENLAYLLKYDTAYGKSGIDISVRKDGEKGYFRIDGKDVLFLQQKEPALLPWNELDVDIVVESTGFFTEFGKAKAHLDAGAKRVVISAPAKGGSVDGIETATVLVGVNEDAFKTCHISSNASCTTNASSPLIQILHETIGVEKALLDTIHGYTATQAIVDSPSAKDFRKGRAAAQNIIPSTTGAAIAVTKAIPELEGKFDGIAMRVPVITGSIADITFVSKRNTSVEEVNEILRNATADDRWKSVFAVTDEPIVSSDIIGDPHAAIADLSFTRVVGGNLVKVLSWYDNEMGYTHAMVEHVIRFARYI